MPHHPQYKLPNPRRGSGGGFFFRVVGLLIVGVGVWVWWQSRHPSAPRPQPKPAAPATNRVVSSKPVFVPPQTNGLAQPKTSPASVKLVSPTPQPPPGVFPRPVRGVFEAQLALARNAISPGSLDGVMGSQTRAAILAFQRKAGLPETADLDANTRTHLLLTAPTLTIYTVTSNDLARLQPLSTTWLGKSQQTALDYETILELVAEKGRASPNLIRRLNPAIDWTNVVAGTEVQIPDVTCPEPRERAGFAVISLGEKKLEAFDANTNLLAHFPCSIAARFDKRPVGELRVKAIAPNPDYTFNPEVFPESAEARQIKTKLILPPGPNNPVGTAWISLDKPGYGMHGTPGPEQVGRTESHGCFRLANWNAEYLLKLVWVGMPVYVAP
ncbi:MAG: L,D-transpeptidase family protein [Verrucomicrobia bacterium]|nr:L,D-transpeptidase family protein [Verrucomicrobiota bacterium]